jgi:hypothetical protein
MVGPSSRELPLRGALAVNGGHCITTGVAVNVSAALAASTP